MELEDAFGVLGLKQSASEAEVRRAYRQLLMAWHPDRFARVDAEARQAAENRTRELIEAHTALRQFFSDGDSTTDQPPSSEQLAPKAAPQPASSMWHATSRAKTTTVGASDRSQASLMADRMDTVFALTLVSGVGLLIELPACLATGSTIAASPYLPLSGAVLFVAALGMFLRKRVAFVSAALYLMVCLLIVPLPMFELVLTAVLIGPATVGVFCAHRYHQLAYPFLYRKPPFWSHPACWLSVFAALLLLLRGLLAPPLAIAVMAVCAVCWALIAFMQHMHRGWSRWRRMV